LNHLRSPFKGFEICGGMMNDLGEKVKWGDSGEEGAASEEGDVNLRRRGDFGIGFE
jgi:hypothetical protein